MGEVYRARDTRLDRIVALKVSRSEFGERFKREARAVAALNHPQICALYDVGPDYLVMEFVQGETLTASLQNGTLSTDVALRYATQIVQALAAAHGQGIIHRDLKPGNIMLRPDGTVKLLDFGLARFSQPACAGSSDPADAPTQTQTQPGTILGTPAYMSPEQARGAAVGAASDLWSLGVVLYEMFTGGRPFRGNSQSELMAEILFRDPSPVRSLKPRVPREVASLIDSMLVKDPARRCDNATEVARILQQFASRAGPTFQGSKRPVVLTAVFVLLAILGAAGALIYRSSKRTWARYEALPQGSSARR
jgi:serine/threonine protein kinase